MAEGLSEEKIAEYKEAFAIFDKDGNGHIDCKELGNALRALGMNPTKQDIDEMIAEADTKNTNGVIEFDEFTELMEKKKKDPETEESELREAFKIFDKNGDNHIDKEELRKVLVDLGEDKLTDEEVNEIFREADIDDDGKITYEEFIKKMMSR